MNEPYAIGIDIGGSRVKAAALTLDGRPITEMNRTFDPERRLHFAETARDVAHELARSRSNAPTALGICAPGLPARDNRSIACLPNRLAGIEGLDWGRSEERRVGKGCRCGG